MRPATCLTPINPLMAELNFLGQSFYLDQNDFDVPYLKSCGFLRLQNAHSNRLGIHVASTYIFAVIRESSHAHFLTRFLSDMRSGTKSSREHAIWRRCKGKGLFPAFIHAKNTACGPLGS